jgi:hypothetical protein
MDPALVNNPNIVNVQAFQGVQQEIINIGRRLARMEAMIANTRISSHNMRHLITPLPLQKCVSLSKTLIIPSTCRTQV